MCESRELATHEAVCGCGSLRLYYAPASYPSQAADFLTLCLYADVNGALHRADATIAAQATGAMSWAFITALRKNPQQSYVQLLNNIRDELARKYTQRPQLSCSHPLSKSTAGLSFLL